MNLKFEKIMPFVTLTGLVFFGMGLLLFPADTSKSCVNGINLCINGVFPSLFPFFVVSSMLISSGAITRVAQLFAPLGKALFGISGEGFSAFLMGISGGYPVGVRSAVQLYEEGKIGKAECQRLLLFCNNSGPAFILGIVGVGLLGNVRLGVVLYGAHILSAVLVGILVNKLSREQFEMTTLPGVHKDKVSREQFGFVTAFISSVTGAMNAMLNVCGFVIFFGVFVTVLHKSGIITNISALITAVLGDYLAEKGLLDGIIAGVFELTGGISALSGANTQDSVITSGFLLGWAGLSVHFQALAFISRAKLASKGYFLAKLTQGGLSSALLWLYFRFFPVSQGVFGCDYPYYYGLDPEMYAGFLRGNLILTGFFMVLCLILYSSIVFYHKIRYNRNNDKNGRSENICFTEKG